ncbi:enoyl-CoA hydratase/isomerase family protein [Loktanella sp. SALINAS62]|uniref:enoyl-CoA hydratase/isomerase family protein n=1 Tax=Loktanella sp. SALINAS62 TaxID=2706124 RepID=UPI001B8C5512|nr:enoyl-CoA hydratase/isomerase family protein [Loktanella sp. SALINAS62]MBS1302329.1 enoyl-CoA hydratase/isomerase family protein [Loktanella sp. SALINAS62]
MIRTERVGNLVVLTLDRPDKANALTAAMLTDLRDAVLAAYDASALILTGNGRVFSAGADLQDITTLATSPLWEEVSSAIARHPGLTIAALNGTLAGGAMGMALACDMRTAVPSARFFYPVIKMGVRPQPSDPARLIALCGPARARMLLMGASKWTADQALTFGLIDDIADDPVAAAKDLCAAACAADPAYVRDLKSVL